MLSIETQFRSFYEVQYALIIWRVLYQAGGDMNIFYMCLILSFYQQNIKISTSDS